MKVTFESIEKKYNVMFPMYVGEIYWEADDVFEYYYGTKGAHGGPWVTIRKNANGTWFYERLNRVSVSGEFDTLQACIDTAYKDMGCSKY